MMPRDRIAELADEAVRLRGDAQGVAVETRRRNVQHNDGAQSFHVSLNPDWLAQLNLNYQRARTVHGFSAGLYPVIVQRPAIIIQPEAVILDD